MHALQCSNQHATSLNAEKIVGQGSLKTYYDVIKFIESCKNDNHDLESKILRSKFCVFNRGLLGEILKIIELQELFQ